MLVSVLECLHQTNGLVNTATNWQIIDGDLTQVLLAIDDEQAAVRNAGVLVQDTIAAGNVHGLVGQEWNVQLAETALFAGGVDPRQVGEVGVGRAAD